MSFTKPSSTTQLYLRGRTKTKQDSCLHKLVSCTPHVQRLYHKFRRRPLSRLYHGLQKVNSKLRQRNQVLVSENPKCFALYRELLLCMWRLTFATTSSVSRMWCSSKSFFKILFKTRETNLKPPSLFAQHALCEPGKTLERSHKQQCSLTRGTPRAWPTRGSLRCSPCRRTSCAPLWTSPLRARSSCSVSYLKWSSVLQGAKLNTNLPLQIVFKHLATIALFGGTIRTCRKVHHVRREPTKANHHPSSIGHKNGWRHVGDDNARDGRYGRGHQRPAATRQDNRIWY